ncbi:unnamed protein product [Pleuronectes platessa]|uniref:Uncharacterized protein n=1 Tax=Pleuronectes platessa TaxID=8262 RepID=A0A9N7YHZ7_PLEPL|nr:unnamed protein product [Pleuronectes platessa]
MKLRPMSEPIGLKASMLHEASSRHHPRWLLYQNGKLRRGNKRRLMSPSDQRAIRTGTALAAAGKGARLWLHLYVIIADRSRGSAPCPAHSLRDTKSELVHVKELVTDCFLTTQTVKIQSFSGLSCSEISAAAS